MKVRKSEENGAQCYRYGRSRDVRAAHDTWLCSYQRTKSKAAAAFGKTNKGVVENYIPG
jgi:hypothetical protein